jgi:hypothetical protein
MRENISNSEAVYAIRLIDRETYGFGWIRKPLI